MIQYPSCLQGKILVVTMVTLLIPYIRDIRLARRDP